MKEFIIDNIHDSKEIAHIINTYGVAVFPGLLQQTPILLNQVTADVNDRLNRYESGGYQFGRVSRTTLSGTGYTSFKDLFSKKYMKDIVQDYAGGAHPVNSHIFITHDFKTDEGVARNGELHYDRRPCFKFMFYLSDVGEFDGPFTVVPGSHIEAKEIHREETAKYNSMRNRVYTDNLQDRFSCSLEEVPILGQAGTLIIFDTMTLHKGGETSGGERLLIRGHTYL